MANSPTGADLSGKKAKAAPSEKRTSTNYRAAIISIIAFGIGLIAVIISGSLAPDCTHRLPFVSLLLATALASGITGILLGFLFGIPKLNKNYNPYENYTATQKYDTNTNLEEISDWLTKIIVGVSLTQLTKVPGFMARVADFVLSYQSTGYTFAKPLVIALIVYFIVCGFLVGYFYTRIWLPKLLSLSESNRELEATNNAWKQSYKQGVAAATAPPDNADPSAGPVYKTMSTSTDNAAVSLKIKALTQPEADLVKRILNAGNRYVIPSLIVTVSEFSALNVLLGKGIVEYLQGDKPVPGAILTVTDKEVQEYYAPGTPQNPSATP